MAFTFTTHHPASWNPAKSLACMLRVLACLLPLLLAGCVSHVDRPEVIGTLIDADTGKPIRGALVVWNLPEQKARYQSKPLGAQARTSRYGRFRFQTERESEFFIFHSVTPASFAPSFTIFTEGFPQTNITGHASSNTCWRVDLGRIKLSRQ